jgi:O-antigen/teichoic acid export membrane protein
MSDQPLTRMRDFRLSAFAERAPPWARSTITGGAGILVATNVLRAALRLCSNLILTRILAPDAFGVIGVVASIIYLFVLLLDMGFNEYVIRHARTDAAFLSVVWTARMMRNAVLAVVMFAFAGPLAAAFGNPDLRHVVAIGSLIFILDGLVSISYSVAMREGRVARVSILELVELASQTAIVIIAAAALRSYWALIIGLFWSQLFRITASYLLLPRIGLSLKFDRQILNDIWRFAKAFMPASLVGLALMQADKIFMAQYFPLSELGLYMLASTIAATATSVVDQYSERIVYPRAARAMREGSEDGQAILYASKRRLFAFFAIGLGGLIPGSELVARILFDDRYLGAGLYLSLLAIVPLTRLITAPAMYMMIAHGKIGIKFETNLLRLGWLAAAGPLGYFGFGPLGVIAAASTVELPVILWCWRGLGRLGVLRIREDALLLVAAAIGAGAGFAANAAVNALIAAGTIPSF